MLSNIGYEVGLKGSNERYCVEIRINKKSIGIFWVEVKVEK